LIIEELNFKDFDQIVQLIHGLAAGLEIRDYDEIKEFRITFNVEEKKLFGENISKPLKDELRYAENRCL
jgi:hypothetical protein